MKYISLSNIISLDINIYNLGGTKWSTNRWGKQQKYNIIGIYNNNIIILKLLPIFIDLKKIIYITNNIVYNMGSCLSCFLLRSHLNNELEESDKKEYKLKDFFIAFIDQWYGLISNFEMFIKYRKLFYKEAKKITNYNRSILPNLVFMSDGSWKYYDFLFYIFNKCGLISIKSGAFIQNDINICYNIFVGDSYKIYELLKYIYIFYKIIRIKKW
jgi:hypothetical protein